MNREQGDNTESGRMYDIVEDFVKKFDKIVIKEGARSMQVSNPIDGKPTSLASHIGNLVAEYVRLSDVVNEFTSKYANSSDPTYQLVLSNAIHNQSETAEHLHQAIRVAHAHNLIDEGLDKELDALREENVELTRRIDELSKQLKKCQDDFESYKKYVHGSGGEIE